MGAEQSAPSHHLNQPLGTTSLAAKVNAKVVDLYRTDINLSKLCALVQNPSITVIRLHGSRNVQVMLKQVATAEEMRILLSSSSGGTEEGKQEIEEKQEKQQGAVEEGVVDREDVKEGGLEGGLGLGGGGGGGGGGAAAAAAAVAAVATEARVKTHKRSAVAYVVVLVAGDAENVTDCARFVQTEWDAALERTKIRQESDPTMEPHNQEKTTCKWYVSNHKLAVRIDDKNTLLSQNDLPNGCKR